MKNFTSDSQKIGQLGEDIACKFLMKHGFSVLERNYTRKWGEIDIVAKKGEMIYFIEVKSVSRPFISSEIKVGGQASKFSEDNPFEFNRPEENMHPWKLKRLSRVVQTYLIDKRIGNTPWQFDLLLVYIDLNNRKARVRKIENIIL